MGGWTRNRDNVMLIQQSDHDLRDRCKIAMKNKRTTHDPNKRAALPNKGDFTHELYGL